MKEILQYIKSRILISKSRVPFKVHFRKDGILWMNSHHFCRIYLINQLGILEISNITWYLFTFFSSSLPIFIFYWPIRNLHSQSKVNKKKHSKIREYLPNWFMRYYVHTTFNAKIKKYPTLLPNAYSDLRMQFILKQNLISFFNSQFLL